MSSFSRAHDEEKLKFVEEINRTINDTVKALVRRERKACDDEVLDQYHKLLRIKISRDDYEPYKRRLYRRYLHERKRKINEIKRNHKNKVKVLKDQIDKMMNDDQLYVDQLKEMYNVNLAEHKRAIYDAYIKKTSTKSYTDF